MRDTTRPIAFIIIVGSLLALAISPSFARNRKAKKTTPAPAAVVQQVAPNAPDPSDPKSHATVSQTQGAGASAASIASPTDAPAAAAAAAATAGTKTATNWNADLIAAASARCKEILGRIHAVSIPHDPIKQGACGAPAPIELVSIGQNPEVALSPPAIVTCELAETLVKWLEDDLQPLARKHLHSQIIKIDTMSSYACRNAYGRKTTFLSEHAVANALDIGDFVTESAETASVLQGWGTPQREVLAKLAADKAAAEKLAADKAAAEKAGQKNLASDKSGAEEATPPSATASSVGAPAAGIARTTIIDGIPKLTVTLPGAGKTATLSLARPDKLGGPKHDDSGRKGRNGKRRHAVEVQAAAVSQMDPDNPEVTAFLHEAHAAACKMFGTTLGPEANADHRNHFHVDMAPRKYKKICD